MQVLIADDHALFRRGLLSLLDAAGLQVVGEATDGEQAVSETARLKPDLVLLDIDMPRLSGFEALRRIRQEHPEIKIVMLTASMEGADLMRAIEAGADGYLVKNIEPREFVAKLEGLARGEAALSGEMAAHLISHYSQRLNPPLRPAGPPNTPLSDREIEALRLVASGHSNRQIAASMNISENTAKFHLKRILKKLGLKNRAEAAAYAVNHGLTGSNPD